MAQDLEVQKKQAKDKQLARAAKDAIKSKGPLIEDLTGSQKSALVLISLGEDIATGVFQYLNHQQIKSIGMAMDSLSAIPPTTVQDVYQDFLDSVTVDTAMFSEGNKFLSEVATRVLGVDKARALLAQLKRASGETLELLSNADSRTLANVIAKEHPQTIAVILAHTVPNKASEIIPLLPEETQVEVVLRIAKLDNISPDILEDVENALKEEITSMGTLESTQAGGVTMVANILNSMDKTAERAILEEISEQQPELADKIRQQMFTFEDLQNLDRIAIQKLLKDIESDDLVLSLKTANEELKEKFFTNMSQRGAAMIRDDLENMGPVRLSDVEKAQMNIVQVAMKLEEEGQIVLSTGGGDDMFV